MRRSLFLAALLLLTLGVVQADSGSTAQTVVASNLNDGPYSDANVIGNLPVNTNVTIITRQGGWYQVRTAAGQSGWLPMTSLRLGTGAASSSNTSNSSSFASLFESGRAGAGGTTSTTGVRGLNTGDIANATPDPQAVTELAKWTAKPKDATQFAAALPAKAAKVDYLPKVKP